MMYYWECEVWESVVPYIILLGVCSVIEENQLCHDVLLGVCSVAEGSQLCHDVPLGVCSMTVCICVESHGLVQRESFVS